MAKLKDFIINDLTGGLVLNESDNVMADNQLKDSLNLEFDENGKLKRRRGIVQFGDTKSGIIDESVVFTRQTLGAAPGTQHLIITRAADGALYRVFGNYLSAAINTATVTVPIRNMYADFTGAGNLEINGDIVAYTAQAGATFTGATGIRATHPIYSEVHQILSLGATGVDTRSGAYFSVLNNLLFINGRTNNATYDGTNITTVADTDEPAGIFATNYRNRIYVAGSGATDGAGSRNGSPNRISYCQIGDPTDWGDYTTDFEIVEDDRGESITGLKEMNDVLLIFKMNSIFSYDEIQLKQRLRNVGAYSHKVVQKIGELLYTFCPTGVWVTNGASAQKISDPISKYIENFKPEFETVTGRVITNCFAGQFKSNYYLYLHDSTQPAERSDVVLVYDTIKGTWTVHDTYTNFAHFGSFQTFLTGAPSESTAGGTTAQHGEGFFAGDTGGKYWRLFENTFLDNEATRVRHGGDIIPNLVSNSAGTAIQTIAETKFYNIGDEPTQLARVRKIAVLVEQGTFQVSYRLDKGTHITDWISLGDFKTTITERKLKEKENIGYRIAFKITSNTADIITIFNAIILKERETIEQTKHGIRTN